MAGNSSRNKGITGEREVIHLLQPIVNKICLKLGVQDIPLLERNTLQCNKGGNDIAGLDWIALEVKRQESEVRLDWWEQVLKNCKTGQVPVLLYRQSRKPWRVQMFAALTYGSQPYEMINQIKVDITINDFLAWFEKKVEYEINKVKPESWPPRPPSIQMEDFKLPPINLPVIGKLK